MSETASWIVHTLGILIFLWGMMFCKAINERGSDQNTLMQHLAYSGVISAGLVLWMSLVLFLVTR